MFFDTAGKKLGLRTPISVKGVVDGREDRKERELRDAVSPGGGKKIKGTEQQLKEMTKCRGGLSLTG